MYVQYTVTTGPVDPILRSLTQQCQLKTVKIRVLQYMNNVLTLGVIKSGKGTSEKSSNTLPLRNTRDMCRRNCNAKQKQCFTSFESE